MRQIKEPTYVYFRCLVTQQNEVFFGSVFSFNLSVPCILVIVNVKFFKSKWFRLETFL